MALSVAVLLVFIGKLVEVQVLRADELATLALAERLVTVEVTPVRADIVDRNGTVLATSVERYNLTVDQVELSAWTRTEDKVVTAAGPVGAAGILAPILGLDAAQLAASLTGEAPFAYVAKNLTPETIDIIRAERIDGIGWEPTFERLYPNGAIAGNIVGFMGGKPDAPGVFGLGGVELKFEDVLTGEPGSRTYESSLRGTVIPTGVLSQEPAVEGETVVLTIDGDLQYFTEQALAAAIAETGSSGGVVVVLDAKTSEVLALADSGSVDPANPGATAAENRGSGAVEDVFEPGSTAKTITLAAAMEEGVITPESPFVATYQYTTANGQVFKDSHPHPDQQLTATGVLVSSSNTGTIQIGQLLSDEVRYDYMSAFGLGEPTDLGLPGESAGILHPWEEWDGRTKYATMYGQGVSVTAIQTAQVYAIIANGGVKLQPTIVKGFESADGTFTERETADPVQVVSAETAAQMMTMLEEVTESGTGANAQIPGYRVAGKTGTAQAADGEGGLTSIVASFVGIAPADDPRIVVSVILYDPQTTIWGGTAAAPLFQDVATFALQAQGVPPSTGEPVRYPTTWE